MGRIWNAVRRIRIPPRAELRDWFDHWMRTEGRWYGASALVHLLALMCLLFAPIAIVATQHSDAPTFVSPAEEKFEPVDLTHFHLGDPPLDPTELTTESLKLLQPPSQTAQFNDNSPVFKEAGGGTPEESKLPSLGGLGGFSVKSFASGAQVHGRGGVGSGQGFGTHAGVGGAGEGFGTRGSGHREALSGLGGTHATERAVAAALYWLSRHQETAGNWSLSHFNSHCTDHPCSGRSELREDSGATALALLTFLAAGQTHKSDGPYRDAIHKGIFWLVKKQSSEGNLAVGNDQPMYSHGLATIALCEAYGMTHDPHVGGAAQSAVAYIERAQDQNSGGWRYVPQSFGDTSVFGWQVMALKSAQMAGLAVNTMCLEKGELWLNLVAKGSNRGLYAYQQYREASPTMTAVGMLCRQYMGARSDTPAMLEGKEYLKEYPPINSENSVRDTYYWYYATQVMFNLGGPDWDNWNRMMRRTLIETQCKSGCAMGSWDPERPTLDIWGMKGGRIVSTALSTLTLEVYYRYLPLYRVNKQDQQQGPVAPLPPVDPVMAQQNPVSDPGPLEKPAAAPTVGHGIGL
jgi:hypothetical protein